MKEKIIRFMQGRYGADTLSNHLMVLALILMVINMFTTNFVLTFIDYVLLIYVIFRMFSKNTSARYHENTVYLYKISPLTRYYKLVQKRLSDRSHKYYRCPHCHQMVRLPKGKGKIVVTCPKCSTQFEKRT